MRKQVTGEAGSVPEAREVPYPLARSAVLGEKRHSPSKLAALLSVMQEAGVPSEAVLAGTGLDPQTVAEPFMLTSSLQFLEAARNAIRLYPGTDLGLRVGARLRASSYGMYGYALLCSETMRQAFDTAVKYHELANGLLSIEWVQDGNTVSWVFPTCHQSALPDTDENLFQFVIDVQLAVHVTIAKDVMGAWCVPARATYAEAAPPHAACLCEALECPVEFAQGVNTLSYPASWLSRRAQLANSITAAHVSKECAKLVDQFRWQAGITRRVYQEVTRSPGHFPAIEKIAENLCMTSRTLRRRLEAEGTSYSSLLACVRKALAIDFLETTQLTTEDIADRVGFCDGVAFRHAFKRWTGATPNEYRSRCSVAPAA